MYINNCTTTILVTEQEKIKKTLKFTGFYKILLGVIRLQKSRSRNIHLSIIEMVKTILPIINLNLNKNLGTMEQTD